MNDGRGQQYTCAIYQDGRKVPRINISFAKEVKYKVVVNESGVRQGAVNASTSIGGMAIPVEWLTWTSRTDRIRLRESDAVQLVEEIQKVDAKGFRLELYDNPELSASYNVSNLTDAIAANEMTCFAAQ